MKRLVLQMICALLCICIFVPVRAEEVIDDSVTELNPLYSSYFDEADIELPEPSGRKSRAKSAEECTTVGEAADVLRKQMKLRSTEVTVPLNILKSESGCDTAAKLASKIFHAAFEHTGVSTEGDYLRYHYLEYKCSMKYQSDETYYSGTFTYTISYMTDMAMEDEVTAYLQDVYEELGLSAHTDIEKIRRIYDYICGHTSYDNTHDSTYKRKYSAYAALIDGTSVCQGYSSLFYRMALDNGLDCRVVNGTAGSVSHAWNTVRLQDRYYLLDATWDSGRNNKWYFLLCEDDLTGHYKNTEQFGDDFDAVYPPAEKSYVRLDGIEADETVYYYQTGTVSIPVRFGPSDATVTSLRCTSDDGSVVSVSNNKLRILKEGSTQIHIITDDGYHTADINVIVTFDTYALDVQGGGGSGSYHEQEEVTVSADIPEGYSFVRWEADFETDADLTDSEAVFRMPAKDCSLRAVFEKSPVIPGWKHDSKGWRYLDQNGIYSTSKWQLINDSWYYLDTDSYMHTGWLKYKGSWYYLRESGSMLKGWKKYDGSWYYFRDSGKMAAGWVNRKGKWYYFMSSGEMVTGWKKIDTCWYYFLPSGVMASGWQKINGSWYYFRDSGKMAAGWVLWEDKWYRLTSSGRMATGWIRYKDRWYYLRESGSMMRYWAKIAGDWYYFEKNGAMYTGWLTWKNRGYYLKEDGRMATGTCVIDGKTYEFGTQGELVKK